VPRATLRVLRAGARRRRALAGRRAAALACDAVGVRPAAVDAGPRDARLAREAVTVAAARRHGARAAATLFSGPARRVARARAAARAALLRLRVATLSGEAIGVGLATLALAEPRAAAALTRQAVAVGAALDRGARPVAAERSRAALRVVGASATRRAAEMRRRVAAAAGRAIFVRAAGADDALVTGGARPGVGSVQRPAGSRARTPRREARDDREPAEPRRHDEPPCSDRPLRLVRDHLGVIFMMAPLWENPSSA
jgi:hypothetical protein